ncbi:hypothetical protein ANN_13419 [Periplaneta americana]|uniref:Uncharacterized protein n=1 Tax=Periplaneta americana TaxID=6978 RepID=A0ABQ8TL57_PERAM|nr:hypothetical protein ANN_13419 [Periplaneta americana]
MASLCEGGNEPPSSLKANSTEALVFLNRCGPRTYTWHKVHTCGVAVSASGHETRPGFDSRTGNMSCCQEVKRRIAMAIEATNRKRSIFCGPLEKELKKRLVKCFVWSVALYTAETWALRRSEEKRIEAFEMRIWRSMQRVK